MSQKDAPISVTQYADVALDHLARIRDANREVMERLTSRLVEDVKQGRDLLVFGSGHSALFPLELYHRAGGASFVLPVVADYLMPNAGPTVIRVLERTPGASIPALNRVEPRSGEMIWIASQSGINAAALDVAIESRARGLYTVAFTSRVHSQAVQPRHPSGKRLFEVCDAVVDLGGLIGDASVELSGGVRAGALSTLGSVFLGHSILVAACGRLEAQGIRCTYTSVNTPDGESRNRSIEERARRRDPLLR
jgi:uncharacterized phosphosugar-binding protein